MRALARAVGLAVLLTAGCNLDIESMAPGTANAPSVAAPSAQADSAIVAPLERGENLRIASFNIQVFGQSKLNKPEVMQVLVQTVRQFDVVAIQEVRSADQDVLPRFVQLLNVDGARYDFILGPRLGRTSSKEQYAFVFDTTRVGVDPQMIYTIADPQDLLHREPLVTRFYTLAPSLNEAFTFVLVNIHTDPDETDQELNALDDVFQLVQSQGEDDVILLGDLNVDERNLGELGQLPGITWTVAGEPTNTRRSKSYDNIVFDRRFTVEYAGYAGVFDFASHFGLSQEQALEVSDHFPVWAEFRWTENQTGRPLAARPEDPAR